MTLSHILGDAELQQLFWLSVSFGLGIFFGRGLSVAKAWAESRED